jgi:hypothetical protein
MTIHPSSAAAADAAMGDDKSFTWNDRASIAAHREMSPAQRVALALQASRAALRFANGRRVSEDGRG